MTSCEQFWWNWGVNLAVAVGTFGAVYVALYGERLRARLFRPSLELDLTNPLGESTRVQLISPDGSTRSEEARYYHVRVANASRWPIATQVQVYLIRIERPDASGRMQIVWTGDMPLRWRLQEVKPIALSIGPPADCDLCSVVKGKWLALHPLVSATNLDPFAYQNAPPTIVLTLQARGTEGDSLLTRFEISWDQQWEPGDLEMARHFVVRKAQ